MSTAFDRTVDLIAEQRRDAFTRMLRRGGAIADIFAEESFSRAATLHVRRGRRSERFGGARTFGAGLHVFDAARSFFTSTEDVSAHGLRRSADDAASGFSSAAAAAGDRVDVRGNAAGGAKFDTDRFSGSGLDTDAAGGRAEAEAPAAGARSGAEAATAADLPVDALDAVSDAELLAILHRAADAAQSLAPDAREVTIELKGRSTRFVVASSDGRFVRSSRSRLGLRVRLQGAGGREVRAVGGGEGGLGVFLERRPEDVAREAAERLRLLERCREATGVAREQAVVIAGGWGGVWLHEVVGHALEADVASCGSHAIGRRVAGEGISVVDEPAGSVDDEGTPGARTVLIEAGVLRGLLTDRAAAMRLGLPESGNGRRQSFRHPPLPRMTRLMLEAGPDAPEDLIRAAGSGIYVTMIGSGRVFLAEDRFSFDILEARLIEGGRLGPPVTGLRLEGRPSDSLRRVVGVGNDFRIDPARGSCEKKGQVVGVSVGMPTILLDGVAVTSRSSP